MLSKFTNLETPLNKEVTNKLEIDTYTHSKKTLSWYLDGYDDEIDRYNWSNLDEPKGREIL